MKKIIILSMGLLFPVVQAQVLSAVDITYAVTVLAHTTDFVETCHVLCAQGLTHDQIIEQLMQSDEIRAYFWMGRNDGEEDQYKAKLEKFERVSGVAGACLLGLVFAFWVYLEIYYPNKNNFYSAYYDDFD